MALIVEVLVEVVEVVLAIWARLPPPESTKTYFTFVVVVGVKRIG